MSFREMVEYAKENPQRLWFKRRWYGWGWIPVTWQGFATIVVAIGALILNALYFESRLVPESGPTTMDLVLFLGAEVVIVAILIAVCFKKGETPRWSWGDPRKKG